MKEFREYKERKHEWDSDALDEQPESVSDIFDQQDEALKEADSPPLEKTPESVSDIFTKQIEALKEGNLTLDHIWEGNSSPLENVSEKKSKAKEIWENLTEEGKRLELVVKAELKKRHEQAQELDQLQKIIESSAKDKVKELKIQELTLSQEGQRLQELVKTIREYHAQDKDGDFLDKLFSQGAEKTTDAVTKIFEKADDTTKQTIQLASNKLDKALFKPPEKSSHPESHQKPETPLSHDFHPAQASQAMEDRSFLDVPLENKSEKGEIEEKSVKDSREPERYSDLLQNEQVESDPQITDFKNLEKFLNNDFIRNGYGVLIPFEIIKNNQLLETLKEFNLFETKKLKNPDLGPFLDQLREKLGLGRAEFCDIIGIPGNCYSPLIKNRYAVKLQKLIRLPENAKIKRRFNKTKGFTLEESLKKFLISEHSSILTNGGHYINFYPENLERVKIGNIEYVILPTSPWETPGKRNIIKEWVIGYYKTFHKAPRGRELDTKFGGFLTHEREVYNRTYNQFLKECNIPANIEPMYNWDNPKTIVKLEKWIEDHFNTYKKAPFLREILEQFGGFHGYLRREHLTYNEFLKARGYAPNMEFQYDWKDPATLNLVEKFIEDFANIFGKPPPLEKVLDNFASFQKDFLDREKLTYGEFLKKRGYSPNYEAFYNWEDPATIQLVEEWIEECFKKSGEVPLLQELSIKFTRGFENHLARNNQTYAEFLEARGYPINELDQDEKQKEGVIFDKIGRQCLKILDNTYQFRVFHPILEGTEKKYVVPDGIVHDFIKKPFRLKGKGIYLENGDKFDTIIEIKRSFASIRKKDWDLYTKLASKLKIFLLKGAINLHTYENNGCEIVIYSKNELIAQLRAKSNPSNQRIINSLIRQIVAVDKRLDQQTNREITDFSTN